MADKPKVPNISFIKINAAAIKYAGNGVFYPDDLCKFPGLSWTEKSAIAIILQNDHGKGCKIKYKDFAHILQLSYSRMKGILSKLKKKGKILAIKFDGRHIWWEAKNWKKGYKNQSESENTRNSERRKAYGDEFNERLKEKIRARDKNKCQHPECKRPYRTPIAIHHIDYDKKNNKRINLISLCSPHHNQTNRNRKYWKEFFQKLMRERFPKNKKSQRRAG